MEPISTTILTYGIINSVINLVVRPVGNWLGEKIDGGKKHKEAIELKDYQHKLDLDMLQATKEYELHSREQLQRESYVQRLQEAEEQYRIYMDKWQHSEFDQRVWPLKTPYNNFSIKPLLINGSDGLPIIPCRIFTAKSYKNHDYSRYLETTVNISLSKFLEQGYNLEGLHSTISNIGDWRDEYQDDAFINALWFGLKGQPVIVLNPMTSNNGNTVNIRVTFWGLGFHNGLNAPNTTTLMEVNLGKEKGILIREESRKLFDLGMNNISQELKFNFDLIQNEENCFLDKRNILIEKNIERYRLASELENTVNQKLSKQLSEVFCCFTGLYCDTFHLIEYGTEPIMPEKMLANSPDYKLSEDIGKFYQGVISRLALSGYHGKNMKFIYLKTAKSLRKHPSLSNQAVDVLKQAIRMWAVAKTDNKLLINQLDELEQLPSIIQKFNIQSDDNIFISEIADTLDLLGYHSITNKLEHLFTFDKQKLENDPFNSRLISTNKNRLYDPKKGGF